MVVLPQLQELSNMMDFVFTNDGFCILNDDGFAAVGRAQEGARESAVERSEPEESPLGAQC